MNKKAIEQTLISHAQGCRVQVLWSAGFCLGTLIAFGDPFVEDLLAKMTLEEKVGQCVIRLGGRCKSDGECIAPWRRSVFNRGNLQVNTKGDSRSDSVF